MSIQWLGASVRSGQAKLSFGANEFATVTGSEHASQRLIIRVLLDGPAQLHLSL